MGERPSTQGGYRGDCGVMSLPWRSLSHPTRSSNSAVTATHREKARPWRRRAWRKLEQSEGLFAVISSSTPRAGAVREASAALCSVAVTNLTSRWGTPS